MPLTNGIKLGPYEIMAPLGAGGMGEVYRARDTRLDRTVAIKILPPDLSDDVTRRQRFEREAKVISSLNHPHICTLYDVDRQDSVDFIVMGRTRTRPTTKCRACSCRRANKDLRHNDLRTSLDSSSACAHYCCPAAALSAFA